MHSNKSMPHSQSTQLGRSEGKGVLHSTLLNRISVYTIYIFINRRSYFKVPLIYPQNEINVSNFIQVVNNHKKLFWLIGLKENIIIIVVVSLSLIAVGKLARWSHAIQLMHGSTSSSSSSIEQWWLVVSQCKLGGKGDLVTEGRHGFFSIMPNKLNFKYPYFYRSLLKTKYKMFTFLFESCDLS